MQTLCCDELLLVDHSTCTQLQANPSSSMQLQADPSTCNQLQADPSTCNQLQADPSACNQLQADLSTCNQLQAEPSRSNQLQADPSSCIKLSSDSSSSNLLLENIISLSNSLPSPPVLFTTEQDHLYLLLSSILNSNSKPYISGLACFIDSLKTEDKVN